MGQMLTHHDTLALQDVVRIGDLLLLPWVRLPNLSEGFALQKRGLIDLHTSEIARNQLWGDLMRKEREYAEWREDNVGEPDWINEIPLHVRKYIRYFYAITEEDPLHIFGGMPHTGLSYMISADGLCNEISHLFKLFRLDDIKQLGFLQAPWVAQSDLPMVTPISDGTRYIHSHDVSMLCSVIGHNLQLPEHELNTLRAAGLTHDWGMPAGGDSVKLIDPVAFDEDRNYSRLLTARLHAGRWREIRRQFGIDEDQLVRTVLNEGLLGEILDLADKLAYISRDIDTCLNTWVGMKQARMDDNDAYVGSRALKEIVDEHTHVCSIWDAVRADNGRLVFTDVPRLIAFLKARIVLFRELYYHPRARFGEYLISRILVKKLYDRGELTRDQLLEMNDNDLQRVLNKKYGEDGIVRALSLRSTVRSFKTRKSALAFRRRLARKGFSFSLIEDHRNSIKPCVDWLVDSPRGVRSLEEAYPGDARELYEMANMLPAVHVYHVPDEGLSLSGAKETLELLQ